MPKREARVDFQKPQLALHVAFEVKLGHAGEADPLDDIAALVADIRRFGDFERGGVAEAHRIGAKLTPGEFTGDASLLVDVAVIALDPRLGTVDEFLNQKLDAEFAQLRPQRGQRIGIFRVQRFAQPESAVPAFKPGQRLDDERKAQPKMREFILRWIETARGRNRQIKALRQGLEARLVEQISASAIVKRNALASRSR